MKTASPDTMQSPKAIIDFKVLENRKLTASYSLLRLTPVADSGQFDFGSIMPGQFVEVQVADSPTTFLRRPISVHYVDVAACELQLLVRVAGDGTRHLCDMEAAGILNIMLSLGHGFSVDCECERPLLVGGGVGVAPLLYLGKKLVDAGIKPTFLLAAKTKEDLLLVDRFAQFGNVLLSTDDGSAGHPGLVTVNPALSDGEFDMIYCCGPMPMMKGVAAIAHNRGIPCEVSLENVMACGLGACLCCVEDTVDAGNVCVCKEGPVFDVNRLRWFE